MKRFLKIVLILAGFATALSYFAFRVVFFDPFESAYPRLDDLIPRDVAVMMRRSELDRDFYRLPYPQFFESLKLQPEWREFERTALYADLCELLGLGPVFQEVEAGLGELPVKDPLADLGREIMVLGRLRDDGTLGGAMLLRASFRLKLAVEALRFGWVRKLAGDAIRGFEERKGVSSLELQDGRQLHLFRVQDVVVVGDDARMVVEIHELVEGSGVRMAASPQYVSAMNVTSDVGRPVDFAVDVGQWMRHVGIEKFESGEYDPLLWKWFTRTVLPTDYGLAIGRLFLGSEIELNLQAAANVESLRPRSGGIYSGNSADLSDLYRFCGSVFPRNVFACGYVKLDLSAFLRSVEENLDSATRELLDDFLQRVQRSARGVSIASLSDLRAQFVDCVANEFAFALETQAPYHIPGTPEDEFKFPQKSWGPRIAFVAPVSNRSVLEALVQALLQTLKTSPERFAKVFSWSYAGLPYSFQEVEFIDPEYPSVSVGFLDLDGREHLVVTTTGEFLNEIVAVRSQVDRGTPLGLSQELWFQQAERGIEGFGQGIALIASEGLRKSMEDLSEWLAEVNNIPDWGALRDDVERRLRDERYPREQGTEVTMEQRRALEVQVDQAMEAEELRWRSEELPRAIAERQGNLAALGLFRWAALAVRIRDTEIELESTMSSVASFPR